MRSFLRPFLGLLLASAGTAALAGQGAPEADLLSLGAPALLDSDLQAQRAGEGTSLLFLSESDLQGNVAGNSVSSSTTGLNSISDNAFQNASGFPVVIQNSGNNVLIQNSVIINLSMTP